MAMLEKEGARKPRLGRGAPIYTGSNYASDDGVERGWGVMPPMEYALTVCAPRDDEAGRDYTLRLTEDDMLRTVAEWMEAYARHRAAEKKRNAAG